MRPYLQERASSKQEFKLESRRAVTALERTWDLETFYDLTTLLARALVDRSLMNEDLPDSRERMDVVLDWSNEFNQVHAWDDWDRIDYLQAVENWFNLKRDQLVAARLSAFSGAELRREKMHNHLKGS